MCILLKLCKGLFEGETGGVWCAVQDAPAEKGALELEKSKFHSASHARHGSARSSLLQVAEPLAALKCHPHQSEWSQVTCCCSDCAKE